MKTKDLVLTSLFVALVFVMTSINVYPSPTGGWVHAGYIALFPIAIVFGKYKGAVAGGFGMALYDWLSQAGIPWIPGTFVIVSLVGYSVGIISRGGEKPVDTIIALIVGCIISVGGYLLYNAYYLGFGLEASLVSSIGDSIKVVSSAIIAFFLAKVLHKVKNTL